MDCPAGVLEQGFIDNVQGVQGQCPGKKSRDIVQGVHRQCPGSPGKKSRVSREKINGVHGLCPWIT